MADTKNKTAWTRFTNDQDRLVEKAVAIEQVTPAEFIRKATVERAREIVLQHALAESAA